MKMKHPIMTLAAATLCLAPAAQADWLYSYSAKTLTECDENGVALATSPWIFNVTSTTKSNDIYRLTIKYKTIGAADSLDLSAPIHGDSGVIVALADDFLKNDTSKALLTSVCLPDSLTSIGKEAFNGHKKLVSVTPFIPDGVTHVGYNAFSGCPLLESPLRMGYGPTLSLGTSAFSGASKLPSANLGPAVTALYQDDFKNCSALGSVRLPDTLTSIANQVFENCTALTNVTPFLPDSVKTVGTSAFKSCTKIAGTLAFTAGGDDITINGASFYIAAITNIVFGEGAVYIANDGIMNAGAVRTVRFGQGVLSFSSTGAKGFRFPSYGVRFDVPAGVQDWEDFITTYTHLNWADIPETGNNPSKAKYREIFPDGPEPRCLLKISGSESNTRYIWLHSYRPGGANATNLYVHGVDETGVTGLFGETTPAYGTYVDVGGDTPFVCTAPEFATNGGLTEYRCAGYRIETMDAAGAWVNPVEVRGPRSYTFNPAEAGSTRLTWLWEPYAYGIRVMLPTLMELGSVSLPEPNHNGFYTTGSVVRATASPQNGSSFARWFGNIQADQADTPTPDIVMDGEKVLYPYFAHNWVIEGSNIQDGYWKLSWSGKRSAIQIGAPSVQWVPGFIDFAKPVEGGGTITAFKKDCFKSNTTLTDVRLPDTTEIFGEYAFYSCSGLRNISPFLPGTVTNVAGGAFRNSPITNALSIGPKRLPFQFISGSQFIGCSSIPSLDLGPTITALPQDVFKSCTAVTRITFRGDKPTWNSQSFEGIPSYQVQVFTPRESASWTEWIEDYVTPWADVSAANQTKYFQNFGDSAKRPYGLITSGSNFGKGNNQWVIPYSSRSGTVIIAY